MEKFISLLLIILALVPISHAQEPVQVPPNAHARTTMSTHDVLELIGGSLSIRSGIFPIVTKVNEVAATIISPFVQWKKSARENVTPTSFNNRTVAFTNENKKTAYYCVQLTVRLPVGNPITLAPIITALPEISKNMPETQDEMEQGKFFNTISGRNHMKDLNYNVSEKLIAPISPEDCGKPPDPTSPQDSRPVDVVNTSSVDGTLGLTGGLIAQLQNFLANAIPVQITVELTRVSNYGNASQYCNQGECTKEETDIDSVGLDKTGAWTGSYIPKQKLKEVVSAAGHIQGVQILGSRVDFTSDPDPILNKSITRQKQAACSFTPSKFTSLGITAGVCNAPSTGTSNFAHVCAVADEYKLPCCQLLGIMELETSGSMETGPDSCTRNNQTFACCNGNFCGPAQIACSDYVGYNGNDHLNLCDPVDSAELLARAMLLKKCQAAGECDTYNWAQEGQEVLQKYSVPDGEYTEACYFHGLQTGCFASGCTQYRWGAGKGYGDFVENYCDTFNNDTLRGERLPDVWSPAYCHDCSDEYVNAGRDPLTCTP